MCELYDIENINKTIRLSDIPITLKCSFMSQPYRLRGVVNLRSSGTRSSDPKTIGHFTAICQRRDNSWIQYDDLKETEITVSSNFNGNVQLLLYTI